MIRVDLIIVGQGLAGSVLALQLIDEGYKVMVIDQPSLSSCSKVAAGIWNPVVFKRLTKSWMIDELLPEMASFYKRSEERLGVQLITERHIIKLFSEQQEVDLWKKKADGELKDYLDKNIYYTEIPGVKTGRFGYSKALRSGNLDLKLFLAATRKYLDGQKSFIEGTFDFNALHVSETIEYKTIKAAKIIFADGHLIKNNPFFNYIPMKPAKGEVLVIKSDEITKGTDIINKNAFIMPHGECVYKVGATYNWSELNDLPANSGLTELQSKLEKITSARYEIIEHLAGVRPSVADRRPVVGSHAEFKNVYLFNGLGTKGVMLAPYFAQRLAEHIKNGMPLPAEADISRFNKA